MDKKNTNKMLQIISILLILVGCAGLVVALCMESGWNAPEAVERDVISFALYGDDETRSIVKDVADSFEKQTGCEVEVYCYSTESEMSSKIIGQVAGGMTFDVFYVNRELLKLLVDKNELQDLQSVLDTSRRSGEEFYSVALENGMVNEVQYAMPTGVMPYMIYYNKSLLEKNGLADLQDVFKDKRWNLEGFSEYAREIYAYTEKTVLGLTSEWSVVEPFIFCNEGSCENQSGSIVLDEAALGALNELGQLAAENIIACYDQSQQKKVQELFVSGELPMMVGNLEVTRLCNDVDFEWDIVPCLSINSNFTNSNFEIPMIAAGNGGKASLAKKFISYYVSTFGQKERLEMGECLIPSLNMVFYTSMGGVQFPEHSNYYFFAIEKGYASNKEGLSQLEKNQVLDIWESYMGVLQ